MSYLFLSYAKADRETALAIREMLLVEGIFIWMDENSEELGAWRWPRIEKIIRDASGLVLLVSNAAKESAWLKRELDFAERIQKPIFPILIEGEGWARLSMEMARLGLGSTLDLPDDFADRMQTLSKGASAEPLPPQIPAENVNKEAQVKSLIIGIILTVTLLIVLFRLGSFLQKANDDWYAERANQELTRTNQVVARVNQVSTDVASTQVQIERRLTSIAVTDLAEVITNTPYPILSIEELWATSTALFSPLPCGARSIENDDESFVLYSRPSFDSPIAISFPTNGERVSLTVVALMSNNEGRWYFVHADERTDTGYVPAEAIDLDDDCLR